MRRQAFTLIELLVVIGIVMLLAGMILGVVSMLRKRAADLDNRNRMDQILVAAEQYRSINSDAPIAIQRAMGIDVTFGSIREVLARIATVYGDTTFAGDRTTQKRPPGIFLTTASLKLDRAGFAFDDRIRWLYRYQDNNAVPKVYDTYDTVNLWWGKLYTTMSRQGEKLDTTQEVLPRGVWTMAEYRAAWPPLVESVSGTPPVYTQSCWPASDWTTGGTKPPILHWPWGQPIIARANANPIPDQKLAFTIPQMTPLPTMSILQLIGILPSGSAGLEAYRSDRSPRSAWNDRWGNPLVLGAVAFIPPRFELRPDTWQNGAAYSAATHDLSETAIGSRDVFLRRSNEVYGFSRAVYLAVGSAGPVLDYALPQPWSDTADKTVLTSLWQEITTRSNAAEWTQDSFTTPAWPEGTRIVSSGEYRTYLTRPQEFRQ